MAYTIPEYVDTQEQAILAVASAVKGEQVTGGDGSVNTALDILADALAGENVQVPQTQQGAILALAQYVSGGGGGGGDFTTCDVTLVNNATNHFVFYAPNVYDGTLYAFIDSEDMGSDPVDVALVGGACYGPKVDESASVVMAGSGDGWNNGNITGDCTITFSDAI